MKRTIITLCGSTRFKDAFIKANFQETMAGKIVLTVGWFNHTDGTIYTLTGEEKEKLDELHLDKIAMSDEILVVNPSVVVCFRCGKPSRLFTELSQETECCRTKKWLFQPYIGDSTRREIAFAKAHGKTVRYLEPME